MFSSKLKTPNCGLRKKFIWKLILSLLLMSQGALAQVPELNLSCLNDPQLEWIEVCGRERDACREQVKELTTPPPNTNTTEKNTLYVVGAFLLGVAARGLLK